MQFLTSFCQKPLRTIPRISIFSDPAAPAGQPAGQPDGKIFKISTPCFGRSGLGTLLDPYEEVDRPLKCRLFRIWGRGLAPKTLP